MRRPAHHVDQHQHSPLTGRQLLHGGDKGEPNASLIS